jgi:glyoxylase I family protein
MKIEHFALQVSAPEAMADWYQKHLGCKIKRSSGPPTHQRFLSDDSGSIMLEFYHNPRVSVPDYDRMDPLLVHIAFVSESPEADRDRLIKAGAKLAEDLTNPGGDQLVMLRDPWGVALQLVKRAQPMLS